VCHSDPAAGSRDCQIRESESELGMLITKSSLGIHEGIGNSTKQWKSQVK